MDFRDQRNRDLLRAQGRQNAINTCRKVRDTLDRYVRSRQGLIPVVRVRWFRILLVVTLLVLLVASIKKGLQ